MGELGVTLDRRVKRPGRDRLCRKVPGQGHLRSRGSRGLIGFTWGGRVSWQGWGWVRVAWAGVWTARGQQSPRLGLLGSVNDQVSSDTTILRILR